MNFRNQVLPRLKKQEKFFPMVQQWGQMADPCSTQKEVISLVTVTKRTETQASF
jgi:hypothetical protein